MAITPIDPAPARNTVPYKPWVESLLETDLPLLSVEMEAAIQALNTNSWTGTSTTSYTPNSGGLGTKVFTTQSGKSWLPGQWVTIGYTSDGRENAVGVVQAYSGTSLTIDIKQVSGHSTPRTAWSIAFTSPMAMVGDQEVVVHTGNGYGSTNTKIRRYTTTLKNSGSAITYADSATLGASFTINVGGIYAIYRAEQFVAAGNMGVSLDTATPTTNIQLLAVDEILILDQMISTKTYHSVCRVAHLAAGGVLRPHDSAALNGTTDACMMAVKRIA